MAGSKARGPFREWGDSPPWGGSGALVDRSSARPDFLDRGGFDPETTALAGVRLPWNQPGKPFFADAGELLDELLGQLRQLTESVDLEKLIRRLLGPQCFVLGVVYGVGENFVVSILDLMGMFKTLLLAELYDSTRRNPAWTVWQPGGIARYLTAQMLNEYFGEELHQAAEERDALVAEIKRVFANPGDFFGGMRDQYVKKFNRLLALSADPSPESQFQAGRVFGDLLMDVLAVIGTGAAVAKVASKVPRLLKLAGKLKGKVALRSAVGAGEAEVAASRSGPPATKRASSSAKEPKPAAAETPATDPAVIAKHKQELGLDPATNQYRPAEAETALRLEKAKGINLERFKPEPGQKGDWTDPATGHVYDGCSPPVSKHFDAQITNGNFERALKDHVEHATVDFVVIDTSGLGLTAAQQQALREAIGRAAVSNPGKIVRLP